MPPRLYIVIVLRVITVTIIIPFPSSSSLRIDGGDIRQSSGIASITDPRKNPSEFLNIFNIHSRWPSKYFETIFEMESVSRHERNKIYNPKRGSRATDDCIDYRRTDDVNSGRNRVHE